MSEFEKPIEADEDLSIITLTEEDGSETEFEFLDLIEYEGQEYVILLPLEEDEDDGAVVILSVNEVDDETEEYLSVDDEATLTAVFNIFKDKFKDDFNFVD
jgi:uncharacterized protein YrzB (UPF0473 family)